MFDLKYLKSIMLVLISAVILTTSNVCMDKATAQSVVTPVKPTVAAPVVSGQADTKPLDVVKNPSAYLNKTVKILHSEFSLVLNISPEEVFPFIFGEIDCEEK